MTDLTPTQRLFNELKTVESEMVAYRWASQLDPESMTVIATHEIEATMMRRRAGSVFDAAGVTIATSRAVASPMAASAVDDGEF